MACPEKCILEYYTQETNRRLEVIESKLDELIETKANVKSHGWLIMVVIAAITTSLIEILASFAK